MLGAPKPLASLSSGLLARKGQARPAMRPQGFSLSGLAQAGDQLGWNDMGDAPEPPVPAVLKAREALAESLTPAPVVTPVEASPIAAAPEPVSALTAPAAPMALTSSVAAAPMALPTPGGARTKAAFTLRLDAERHLKLRLACATQGRSAQQLVTAALDAFLANLPVVEQLARQLDRDAK